MTAIGPLPPSQQWPLTPRFIFGHRGHGASPGLQGNRPGMEAHRQSTTKRRREQGGMKNVAAEVQAQRPQVEPQPQRRRRITHTLQFKFKLVKLALARPRGHRIKPVCREFPEVEPVRRRPRPRALRCPHLPLSVLHKFV